MEIIKIIFSNLISNPTYFVKVWPYLKPEYFEHGSSRNMFNLMSEHVNKYSSRPTIDTLSLDIENSSMSEHDVKAVTELKEKLSSSPAEDLNWLVKETEKYVQDSAIYNATSKIIEIQTNASLPRDKQNKKLPAVGAIPDIMREAISVCFDSDLGHDWLNDYEKRWLMYSNKTHKVPFKSEMLNKITKKGAEYGTLNCLLSPSNVGKSLGLCSLASDYLQTGHNVLYITMEMAEHVVGKRIDANLLDVSLDDIDDMRISYSEYKKGMEGWKKKSIGRLKIKQYPTGGANADTFRALLNEYKLKEGFVPDVIIIDYLGICSSCRIKVFSENSYTMVKAVAEELRALAVETQTLMWTAAQTGRSAFDSSDITSQDVAESIGLIQTVDFMIAIIETEELAKQGIQIFKQLKSRYGDKNYYNKFQMKVKKGNQRWVDIEGNAEYTSPSQGDKKELPKNPPAESKRAKIDSMIGELDFS